MQWTSSQYVRQLSSSGFQGSRSRSASVISSVNRRRVLPQSNSKMLSWMKGMNRSKMSPVFWDVFEMPRMLRDSPAIMPPGPDRRSLPSPAKRSETYRPRRATAGAEVRRNSRSLTGYDSTQAANWLNQGLPRGRRR